MSTTRWSTECAMSSQVVTLGPIAHGGSCVARLPGAGTGQVVFVRGGIPGERVSVQLTDTSHATWWRGDVDDVIESSPDRVSPPCPLAGVCGGCDWQHMKLERQRLCKAQIIEEQLERLAGVHVPDLVVTAVAGDHGGLGWRTRMRYQFSGGQVGLRAARSHDLVPLLQGGCSLATPKPTPDEIREAAQSSGGQSDIGVTVAQSGISIWQAGKGVINGRPIVTEQAGGRVYKVRADGFWQVHPGAADALSSLVRHWFSPVGGQVLDLYCGVGLFAGVLSDAGGVVHGIEINKAAVELARQNVPAATFTVGAVEKVPWGQGPVDFVVVDPPRAGAGRAVVQRIARYRPQAVAYIACDPASLARDVATFATVGYRVVDFAALDIFPMTSHVECCALLSSHDPS